MLGAIIGGALGVAGSLLGGASASSQSKKMRQSIQKQQSENQAWYQERYNEDPTQRAAAQRILTLTEERIRQRNKAAAGSAAMTGASSEEIAAAKEAANAPMADAISTINAQGQERQDNLEENYLVRKQQLEGQMNELRANQAASTTQAIQGVLNAGASIAAAYTPKKK